MITPSGVWRSQPTRTRFTSFFLSRKISPTLEHGTAAVTPLDELASLNKIHNVIRRPWKQQNSYN